jgi:hypothetical protein
LEVGKKGENMHWQSPMRSRDLEVIPGFGLFMIRHISGGILQDDNCMPLVFANRNTAIKWINQ